MKHLNKAKTTLQNLGYELDFLPLPEELNNQDKLDLASYANFIFLNDAVLIPSFNCAQDSEAKLVFERNFPDRKLIAIDTSLFRKFSGGMHSASRSEL
jgi:agmatine deiminase